MEPLISYIEKMIHDDYQWMSSCNWGKHFLDQPVPNRYHKSFIDMALVRLVMIYGFSEGTRLSFQISEHIATNNTTKGYIK